MQNEQTRITTNLIPIMTMHNGNVIVGARKLINALRTAIVNDVKKKKITDKTESGKTVYGLQCSQYVVNTLLYYNMITQCAALDNLDNSTFHIVINCTTSGLKQLMLHISTPENT